MSASWWDLFGAALSGGFVVKIMDFIYMEWSRRRHAEESSKQLVNRHLDPVLKAADELVGKLSFLAQNDFAEFKKSHNPKYDFSYNTELSNFCYLFAQFWARVQILRIEGIYVNISDSKDGKKLKSFLDTLESKSVQIVERPNQRAIGELLIKQASQNLSTLTYYEFVSSYKSDSNIQGWFKSLLDLLTLVDELKQKQIILKYGVILHALIDTLDSEHLVTKNREGWANKLTKRSCRDLKFRIFQVYLPFVENIEKYVSK